MVSNVRWASFSIISFQNDAFCVFNFIFGKVQFERFDSLRIQKTKKNAFSLSMNEVNYHGVLATKLLETKEFKFVYIYSLLNNTQFTMKQNDSKFDKHTL